MKSRVACFVILWLATAASWAQTANPIPDQFLPAYLTVRPNAFLVDPQGLLNAADFQDRLKFLNYHASDSTIDLFVYVIGGDQDFPEERRKREIVERFFAAGRPAVIVFYTLGAPQYSTMDLSPALTSQIPAIDQHHALANSIQQARQKLASVEQFETFCVQLSIRIYWMERLISGEPPVHIKDLPAAPISPEKAKAAEKKAEKKAKFLAIQNQMLQFALPAGVVLGLLAMVCVFWRVRRARARYHFPVLEVEPRLGGNHAAGVGAVISFASAAVPPASQRDQMPEYLRRA
jgi:hypothetical protein